jgi:hypothetical protein
MGLPAPVFNPTSHRHSVMNYHYILLLLLVVLSVYSESPQHANLPDPPPIGVTIYPDRISAQLGVLAPVLPQNEVVLTPSGVFNNVIVNCLMELKILWALC